MENSGIGITSRSLRSDLQTWAINYLFSYFCRWVPSLCYKYSVREKLCSLVISCIFVADPGIYTGVVQLHCFHCICLSNAISGQWWPAHIDTFDEEYGEVWVPCIQPLLAVM